jgi:hypothetical protein
MLYYDMYCEFGQLSQHRWQVLQLILTYTELVQVMQIILTLGGSYFEMDLF